MVVGEDFTEPVGRTGVCRSMSRFRTPSLLVLLCTLSCGDESSSLPTGPADSTSDASGSLGATPHGDSPFGVQVGTHPGMEGSLYSVDTFPVSQIISAVAKDAIPAITDPPMVAAGQTGYLMADAVVFGVVIDGEARAYPHNVGWWHEIVNDQINGQAFSVTFCPLTGTGMVYDGGDADAEQRLTLGVSGLLYSTNLVMYDRRDGESLIPQIFSTTVSGPRKGETLSLMPVVETTWQMWRQLYPETLVMAPGPYDTRRYLVYPYNNYRVNHTEFLFPTDPSLGANPNPHISRYGFKERVLGLRIDGVTRAFAFAEMGSAQRVINDTVNGLGFLVAWDPDSRMAIPYSTTVDGRDLTFRLDTEAGVVPFGMRDEETGTLWDVKGQALTGELAGQRLTQLPAHNSMWFAWVSFWPATEIWQSP